ncbi:MAG: lysylphosphatidylglycerol synthase transmembrane domain-containing protein [Bradymonadia bacterium]
MSRRALKWGLQLVAVGLLAWWAIFQADWPQMGRALSRMPAVNFLGALVFAFLSVCLAGWRWRIMLHGFGAIWLPPVTSLIRLFFVGLFYNTFVPGSVGGDVLRGVISRRCFEGGVASYVVVGVDRLIGLSALATVAAVGLWASPPWLVLEGGSIWLIVGVSGAGVLAIAVLVALNGALGDRLRRMWADIPQVHHPRSLMFAWLISLTGHGLTLGAYTLIAHGLGLPLTVGTLAWVVPLALLAAVIPIAVAGVGPREAVVVGLLALMQIPREDALVFSLSFAMILWLMAGVGGGFSVLGRAELEG